MNGADADWGPHLLQLMSRGQVGRAGPGKLLDLPALAQAHACATGVCTPGLRAKAARSCCADLDMTPSPEARAAIEANLEEIAAFMAPRDPRWADGPPPRFDGEVATRPGRRCVFSLLGPEGLSCGLHALEDATGRPRGALKPLPCRLFPLVLVEVDERTTLLSAIHKKTARLAGSRPVSAFPCLGLAGAPTVAASCRDTIAALWGERAADRAVREVAAWAADG